MDQHKSVYLQRIRRKHRVRKRVRGNEEQPRLSVARSHKHISAQIINDLDGRTLASASTHDKDLAKKLKYGGNKDAATLIGKTIAEKATQVGIGKVCFDRGPYRYHGRVAALADAAREAGLKF
jgi:large subunit ribosomal protein L18